MNGEGVFAVHRGIWGHPRFKREPFTEREVDHVGIGIDPARVDADVAEQPEELAAPAADVEHRRCVPEVFDVRSLPFAHALDAAAHAALEREVIGQRGCGWLRGNGARDRCRRPA